MKSSKQSPLSYQQVTKCLELAQKCTQLDLTARPDISDIIDEINEIDSKTDQIQVSAYMLPDPQDIFYLLQTAVIGIFTKIQIIISFFTKIHNSHVYYSENNCNYSPSQIIPCLEDMLRIEPLEIHFPFELDQQISNTIELTNDTDDCFAFNTKTSLEVLHTEPEKGIVLPRSKCSVTVTMRHAQVMALPDDRCKEEITMLSTRVDGGVAPTDITEGMFVDNVGKVVDEVRVTVVLGTPPLEEEP